METYQGMSLNRFGKDLKEAAAGPAGRQVETDLLSLFFSFRKVELV
jgi:hypothetical protein